MNQPDFTSLFFATFAGNPAPVEYSLRQGPNLLHDLAFLSSMVHDARLLNPGERVSERAIAFQLRRDCWELGALSPTSGITELSSVHSVLSMSGILSLEWKGRSPKEASMIDYLWIDVGFRRESQFRFSVVGDTWRVDVELNENAWSVQLVDQGSPKM